MRPRYLSDEERLIRKRLNNKRWYAAHPELNRTKKLQQRYGISESQFNEILTSQDGRCAICGEPERKWTVDHDHDTGAVRGILCYNCNVGLGLFKDSKERLHAAISYLVR